MEVEKTVTQLPRPGVSINPQSGEANVPTPDGNVRVEVKGDGTPHFIFQNTPASNKLAELLLAKNNLQQEAAAAKGQQYNPTIGARVKNLATSNVTPIKLVAFAIIGGVVYKLGSMALKALAEYMGWDMFGAELMDEEMHAGGNKEFDERRAPRTRRPAAQPTQPTATA